MLLPTKKNIKHAYTRKPSRCTSLYTVAARAEGGGELKNPSKTSLYQRAQESRGEWHKTPCKSLPGNGLDAKWHNMSSHCYTVVELLTIKISAAKSFSLNFIKAANSGIDCNIINAILVISDFSSRQCIHMSI